MKRDKKHCFSCGTAESIGLGKCKCGCHTEGKCPHNLARKYCTECRDKYCVVCAVKQLEKKITGSPIYYSPADYLNALEKLTRKRKDKSKRTPSGDDYRSLHHWIRRRLPEPEKCSRCGKKAKLDCANISGQYSRNIIDWNWLCRRCHVNSDGRAVKLAASIRNRANQLHVCLGCKKNKAKNVNQYCLDCFTKRRRAYMVEFMKKYNPARNRSKVNEMARKRYWEEKGICVICKQPLDDMCEGCCADVEAGVHTGKFCGAAGNEVAKE